MAPLVHDGDVVALDSSTRSQYLALELATVLVPGGIVRRSPRSVVGLIGDVLSGRGRVFADLYTDGAADSAAVAALKQAGARVHRVDLAEEYR